MPKRPDREIMGDNNDSFTIDSQDPNSNTKVVVHRSGSIEVQRFPNQEYQDKYETIARTDQVATESAPYKTLHSDDLLNNTIASAAAASASMTDAKASTFQPYSATGNVTNSRAVLSALRALQEKIRKLEIERTQYSSQCLKLEDNLKEYRRQIGAERKKLAQEQLKRDKDVQKVEKQAHEFELSAARTEERINATMIELKHEREDKNRVNSENEKNKTENVKLQMKLKDANSTIIQRQADFDNERILRQKVEAKLTEANEFISKCVQLNEQCVLENTALMSEVATKNDEILEMKDQITRLQQKIKKISAKSKTLKSKSHTRTRTSSNRVRNIGTHHRQTTISRERSMRHGHYQNETMYAKNRKRGKKKKSKASATPQGSPDSTNSATGTRAGSKYHWGHMSLKEQLRQANLGKDPPFMPSGNANAPDFSIYSVTQKRLGNSKAYGERDEDRTSPRSTRSSPPPKPPHVKVRVSPPPQATIVAPRNDSLFGNPKLSHKSTQNTVDEGKEPNIMPVISPNTLVKTHFTVKELYNPSIEEDVSLISRNEKQTAPAAGLQKVMENMEKEYSELHTRYRSMLKSIERCSSENLDVNKDALTAALESLVAKLQAKSEQLMIVRRQLYMRKNERPDPERIQTESSPLEKVTDKTTRRRGRQRSRSPRSRSPGRRSRRSRSPAGSYGSRSPVRSEEAFRGQREALNLLRQYKEARHYRPSEDEEDETKL